MLKRIKDVSFDAVIYGAASLMSQLVGFLLLPLYTAYLTPYDYGILAMLAILTGLFVPLFGLGLPAGVFRFTSKAKSERARRRIVSTAFFAVVLSATAGLLLLLVGLVPLSRLLIDEAPVHLTAITLFTCWLTCLCEVPIAIFRLNRQVKLVAVVSLVSLFFTVAVTVTLVVAFEQGVVGCVLGFLSGAVVQALLCITLTRKSLKFSLNRRQLRILLNYGIWFVPHQVQALGLTYLAQFLIKLWVSVEAAGLYNVALKFVMPFYLVVNSLQKAWKPIKFEIHNQEKNPPLVFRQIIAAMCVFYGLAYLAMSLMGPWLLRFMVDPSFHAASYLIPFLALIPLAHGLYFMFGTGIEFSTSPRKLPLVSTAGVVALLLSSPLIILMGAAGGATATAIGWLVMGGVVYKLSREVYEIKYDFLSVTMGVLVPVIVAPMLVLQGRPLSFGLAVGGGLSVLLVALLWLRSPDISRAHFTMLRDKRLM